MLKNFVLILLLLVCKSNGYYIQKYSNEWLNIAQGSSINFSKVFEKSEFVKFRIVREPFEPERVNILFTSDGLNENIIFYSHSLQEVATNLNCEGEKTKTGFVISRCIPEAYYFSIQMNNYWLSGDVIFKISGENNFNCH